MSSKPAALSDITASHLDLTMARTAKWAYNVHAGFCISSCEAISNKVTSWEIGFVVVVVVFVYSFIIIMRVKETCIYTFIPYTFKPTQSLVKACANRFSLRDLFADRCSTSLTTYSAFLILPWARLKNCDSAMCPAGGSISSF